MIQHVPFLDNIMSTELEILNLIKLSTKRHTMLDKVYHELAAKYHGFCTLYLIGWTVCGNSPRDIVDNWVSLRRFGSNLLKLEPYSLHFVEE